MVFLSRWSSVGSSIRVALFSVVKVSSGHSMTGKVTKLPFVCCFPLSTLILDANDAWLAFIKFGGSSKMWRMVSGVRKSIYLVLFQR